MFEFFTYGARNRIKESASLSVGMGALAAMVIWVYPSFSSSFDSDELLEAYPPQLVALFDIESMGSLEGFLAFELYVFGWVILLALYFAYGAAGVIAADVERGRMDTLLALPVSRSRLLIEKFAALAVPIVTVNAVVAPLVLVGSRLIGESIPAVDVLAVHLLSIPYLFACAGIGLLCSVIFDRASIAQRAAIGATFALFLLESVLAQTGVAFLGAVAPQRYYDPNGILLAGNYDLAGTAILVAMTGALVAGSQLWFSRKDIAG